MIVLLAIALLILLAFKYPDEFAETVELIVAFIVLVFQWIIAIIEYIFLFVYHYRFEVIAIAVIVAILWIKYF